MGIPLYTRRDQHGQITFNTFEDNENITFDPETGKTTFNFDGSGASLITGTEPPADETGDDGDLYIDTNALRLYTKASGAWDDGVSLQGPPGADGSSELLDEDRLIDPEFLPEVDLSTILSAENSTTTELSDGALDIAYPDAEPPFTVVCANITTGGIMYRKTVSAWEGIPLDNAVVRLAKNNIISGTNTFTGSNNVFNNSLKSLTGFSVQPNGAGTLPASTLFSDHVTAGSSSSANLFASLWYNYIQFYQDASNRLDIGYATLTAVRSILFPDLSGTVVLDTTPGNRRDILRFYGTSNTGNTTENTQVTSIIPASIVSPTGGFQINLFVTCNNNANTKTVKLKLNGTAIWSFNLTTGGSALLQFQIGMANSLTVQTATTSSSTGGTLYGTSSAGAQALAIDFASAVTFTATLQCATAGTDTVKIEMLSITRIY